MIKRTLCINNPAFLKKKDNQLVIERDKEVVDSIPIEDIGVLMFDHYQITLSDAVINAILANGGVLITCDATHHPSGVMLPFAGNTLHSEIFQSQVESSVPLRKQLWMQTVKSKILNQAAVLDAGKVDTEPMKRYAKEVRSGDPDNYEGRAAAHYWKRVFPSLLEFTREREGEYPNALLNYGYAVVRATVARGIVSAGLHPALGIHHHNKYNAFCLADDLMEPYRPFVDRIVQEMVAEGGDGQELVPDTKRRLLSVLGFDVVIEGERKPLQLGIARTCSSLVKCLKKEESKILYPEFDAPE